jgi:signal transduction histidine kinase
MFSFLNTLRNFVFRFPNAADLHTSASTTHVGEDKSHLVSWGMSWPLMARVPIVSGALILVVAILVSHAMMTTVAQDQELGVRRLAAVYLDGISTTIYPHVVSRNLANTTEALHRTMWFHQSMREQRAIVSLPDGKLFADVSSPDDIFTTEDPFHAPHLRRQIEAGNGFVFDADTGTGWALRRIVRNGVYVADLYVGLELKPLIEERRVLGRKLLAATIGAGLGAAAIGFLIVRRMVSPVRLLTERLRRAQAGVFEPVPPSLLPPPSSEYGRLLSGYNDLVEALGEREALAARLAERERDSVLGRLAATIAHEVRNPLGGMSTALDTIRKFGSDPDVQAKSLDIIERGLWSIRDVVGSVLAFHRMPSDGRRLTGSDLEDMRVLIEPELARRQLQLSWSCNIGEAIDIPATETRQISLNLLLNACEASPPGKEIGFQALIHDDIDHGGERELRMEVVDSGPGLPPDIVRMLSQTNIPDHRHLPPRGLGIHVVRDLVHGLGGRIDVTSAADGRGTRFTVMLPLNGTSTRETA